jgi:hypothetical protein
MLLPGPLRKRPRFQRVPRRTGARVAGAIAPNGRGELATEPLVVEPVPDPRPRPLESVGRDEVVLWARVEAGYGLTDRAARAGVVCCRGKGRKPRLAALPDSAQPAIDDWLQVRGPEPGPLFCPVRKSGALVRDPEGRLQRLSASAVVGDHGGTLEQGRRPPRCPPRPPPDLDRRPPRCQRRPLHRPEDGRPRFAHHHCPLRPPRPRHPAPGRRPALRTVRAARGLILRASAGPQEQDGGPGRCSAPPRSGWVIQRHRCGAARGIVVRRWMFQVRDAARQPACVRTSRQIESNSGQRHTTGSTELHDRKSVQTAGIL